MGKGGTRFVGEAIAHRSGRAKSSYTNKELRKNMEQFLETGVHPDLERAKQSAGVVVALPDPDAQRPHIFLELTVDNRNAGALPVLASRNPTISISSHQRSASAAITIRLSSTWCGLVQIKFSYEQCRVGSHI
eukprot:GHRQ01031117.1.p1 GENE.GHRQ01031117.1~~GHRQ01031117.1.p1  ORF type:complete len:133 (+),score=30.13 GHRQ01031117.1:573-971(+)